MFKNRNGLYVAEWQIEGKRYTRPTGAKNKAQAKKLQDQWKLEMKAELATAEKARVRNFKGKIIDQTIDEAFGEYWNEKGKHASGSADIKSDLQRIIGYLGPNYMLSDIDTEVILDMRERRRAEFVKWRTKDGAAPIDKRTGKPKPPKPLSNRTINITVGERMKWVLSHMAAKGRQVQAIQWDVIWLNEKPRKTEFTYGHEELLLRTYRKDHLPAVIFALLGGPRRKQFVELRWSQIDGKRRTITFQPLKKKGWKGQEPAPYVIPMTESIERLIRAQIDPLTDRPYHPEFVWTFVSLRTYHNHKAGRDFVRGERYPLTYEGLGTEWERWKKKHGISDQVRMHDLRHAAGERLAEASGDPLIVRDSLNHGDLGSTERYMGRSNIERIRVAMEAREKLDAGRLGVKSSNHIPNQDVKFST